MPDILVAGGGFAGLWAALTAAREVRDLGASLRIALVSHDDFLTLRPRLYEAHPESLRAPMRPALDAMGVEFIKGDVSGVDPMAKELVITADAAGEGTTPSKRRVQKRLAYKRLVLATGSVAKVPPVPGFAGNAFSIDDYASALRLDAHLARISRQPATVADNTYAIIGAGFTGIELACELRDRIAVHAGEEAAQRAQIILLERADEVGPDLGPGPRPQIEQALAEARVEVRTGSNISALEPGLIRFAGGTALPAGTVVLTAGQIPNIPPGLEHLPRDQVGRLQVGDDLRAAGAGDIFAAGDVAAAKVDDDHFALMSCQHAMPMGKHAGYNAAHDLLNAQLRAYRQPAYVTCLDLGRSGAVFTTGWERSVQKTGQEAGVLKRTVNTKWIYPPAGSAGEIFDASHIESRPGR